MERADGTRSIHTAARIESLKLYFDTGPRRTGGFLLSIIKIQLTHSIPDHRSANHQEACIEVTWSFESEASRFYSDAAHY